MSIKDELKEEVTLVLAMINTQIGVIEEKTLRRRTSLYHLQDERGNFILIPLLVAKAQLLSSLITLNLEETDEPS